MNNKQQQSSNDWPIKYIFTSKPSTTSVAPMPNHLSLWPMEVASNNKQNPH
jgi:hypothetical protein